MSETPSPTVRSRAAVALAATGLLVLVALVADVLAAPTPPGTPEEVAQDPAEAGAWYCPATAGDGESAVLSVAAVGEEPSRVRVYRFPEGRAVGDDPVTVAPGDEHTLILGPGEGSNPVMVRWEGGPAVASWRIEAGDTSGAPCEPGPAERWLLAGFDTATGSSSTVHLFNPFTEDAVARIVFATPEGPVRLVLTDSLFVPAGTSTAVDLGEYQPEQPDLGVVVEVLTGRLVAQGEVRMRPVGERQGPTGRMLLPAATAPATLWTFGYARADERSSSWLSVLNTSEREAAVEVRVSTPTPEGAVQEQSVPAGGVLRIDLAELSAEPEFGVAVESVNQVPVVVHRSTHLRTSGREGLAASRGGPPATNWALVGGGAGDRRGRVNVYNPGTEPVTLTLRTTSEEPADWVDRPLPPNGWTTFDLAAVDPARAQIPALLDASGPVVAELRSHYPAGGLRLWTALGVREAVWSGPPTRPAVRRDPSLSSRPLETEPEDLGNPGLELPDGESSS